MPFHYYPNSVISCKNSKGVYLQYILGYFKDSVEQHKTNISLFVKVSIHYHPKSVILCKTSKGVRLAYLLTPFKVYVELHTTKNIGFSAKRAYTVAFHYLHKSVVSCKTSKGVCLAYLLHHSKYQQNNMPQI